MKKVLTFGVFDYFHYGHLKLLERARLLGDFLIVAVQRDEEINKNKPNTAVLYNLQQRMEMINAIRFVDQVIAYSQVCEDIKHVDFDIFARGEDQLHSGILAVSRWCEENGKQVITLCRTPNISSSQIKKQLGE